MKLSLVNTNGKKRCSHVFSVILTELFRNFRINLFFGFSSFETSEGIFYVKLSTCGQEGVARCACIIGDRACI
jgi:hypothetical protein